MLQVRKARAIGEQAFLQAIPVPCGPLGGTHSKIMAPTYKVVFPSQV